jgi:hypothetical protein
MPKEPTTGIDPEGAAALRDFDEKAKPFFAFQQSFLEWLDSQPKGSPDETEGSPTPPSSSDQ